MYVQCFYLTAGFCNFRGVSSLKRVQQQAGVSILLLEGSHAQTSLLRIQSMIGALLNWSTEWHEVIHLRAAVAVSGLTATLCVGLMFTVAIECAFQ